MTVVAGRLDAAIVAIAATVLTLYPVGHAPACTYVGAGWFDQSQYLKAVHAWVGAVRGQRVVPLGVDRFGQSGDIPDLYREYGLDEDAILDACAQALLG